MTLAYFDCFHGAAGDMLLASMLDAGLPLADLQRALAPLALPGYRLEHQRVVCHHVSGSRLLAHVDAGQPQRTWRDIRALLEAAALPERARTWALGAFGRLARAESAVHGVPADEVHFHEVGAVDSIIDMVGVCVALELLGITRVCASPLPAGNGWIDTQHGALPVPAPATLALLAEAAAPLVPTPPGSCGELLTPTAAALLVELVQSWEQPAMRVQRVGYGMGQREGERLNALRVWLGEPIAAVSHSHTHTHSHTQHSHTHSHTHGHAHAAAHAAAHPAAHDAQHETLVELCCNLDDVTGEVAAWALERLLAAGALDAWAVPLVMKKGRPALQLGVLARAEDAASLTALLLRETPTLGVRAHMVERTAAARRTEWVTTPWGEVRLKHKLLDDGEIAGSMPEYEDCAALARQAGVPLAAVIAAALAAGGSKRQG